MLPPLMTSRFSVISSDLYYQHTLHLASSHDPPYPSPLDRTPEHLDSTLDNDEAGRAQGIQLDSTLAEPPPSTRK